MLWCRLCLSCLLYFSSEFSSLFSFQLCIINHFTESEINVLCCPYVKIPAVVKSLNENQMSLLFMLKSVGELNSYRKKENKPVLEKTPNVKVLRVSIISFPFHCDCDFLLLISAVVYVVEWNSRVVRRLSQTFCKISSRFTLFTCCVQIYEWCSVGYSCKFHLWTWLPINRKFINTILCGAPSPGLFQDWQSSKRLGFRKVLVKVYMAFQDVSCMYYSHVSVSLSAFSVEEQFDLCHPLTPQKWINVLRCKI